MRHLLIFVALIGMIIFPSLQIHAELQNSSAIYSTGEILKVGISLTKSSAEKGDFDAAKKYSKFTTDFYGQQINMLRESNVEFADDLHLLLVDIHAKIENGENKDEILKDLSLAEQYFDRFGESNNMAQSISDLLGIVDQSYQTAISKDEPQYHTISNVLTERAITLFDANSSFTQRQRGEIEAFFVDLKSQIADKTNFVSVGKLITTIQRDLTGTDTLVTEQNLYDVIRVLYREAISEIKNGNYDKAEEIVISAYLDHFEYLEADIVAANEDLVHKMEINMREEIRGMIKEKKPAQEIESFIDNPILKDLATAESLVAVIKKPDTSNMVPTLPNEGLRAIGSTTKDEKLGVQSQVDFIRDTLETMLVQYQNKDYTAAFTSARTAYLDSYEHVEIPLRTIDPDFTLEVEIQFAELRNLIKQKADFSEVQEAAIKVRRSLDESERLVTGTGQLAPGIAFTSSFAVVFREGLESVLILGAILTYLEASRNTKFKPFVYYGIILAVGATAVTWVIASYLIELSGANRELIEAVAALSATAVLFYVSFWILNKIEHKKWMEFVKAKVWQASTTGGVAVFVMLSFFTVYREGFETVLFYEAMFGFAKYMEIYVGLGFIAGLGSLFVIYYVTRKLGKRLPLKMLFALTMGVGAYLSIAFLGNAIRELQTLDILPFTSMLGTIPRLDINMAKMTGIYPTLESITGQIILLGVYLVATSYVLVIRPKKEEKIASMRKSRGKVDEFETH